LVLLGDDRRAPQYLHLGLHFHLWLNFVVMLGRGDDDDA